MSNNYSENNKRIFKNTIMLYIRMFLIMFVSLYTVRIVLSCLGVVDYGIYNVIGGIVVMFSFLSNTMSSAAQRYFSFEIGKGDFMQVNNIYSVMIQLYSVCAFLIILASESLGLWYLNNKMIIPVERVYAAKVVFHLSIVSFVLSIISTPFQALIIAQEKMNIYSYIGVIEVILKLALSFLLYYTPWDKLITYSVLMALSTLCVSTAYIYFSKRSLPQLKYKYSKDYSLIKEIASYSGWTIFGGLAAVVRSQGLNLLLNAFFPPVINAARSIAFQVNNAINQFSSNFYTAARPQVIKYYAQKEYEQCFNLVFRSSRLSYYLILIFAIPLIRYTDLALASWLKDVPEYSVLFTQLVIVTALIDSMSHPLMTLAQSTGKIKWYQIIVGGLLICTLPISWCLLKCGSGPEVTMVVSIILSAFALLGRLLILRKIANLSVTRFTKEVLLKLMMVTAVTIAIIWLIGDKIVFGSGIVNCIITYVLSILICICIVLLLGINRNERKAILKMLNRNK